MKPLKIATRQSPLALWQANHVCTLLQQLQPELKIELLPMTSSGDRIGQDTLATSGGKGLFVKELELALLANEADLAVHSLKDVPVKLPEGLILAAVLPREDPRDVFVSENYASFESLPAKAVVGTASLRREMFIRYYRKDLQVKLLRGNVNTRLSKLQAGEFDAIILAAAGLQRLGLDHLIKEYFPVNYFVPAITQGILAIECRADNAKLLTLLTQLNDPKTAQIVSAERSFNARLGGACHIPISGFAQHIGEELQLHGVVGQTDGALLLHEKYALPTYQAEKLGIQVADALLAKGADKILAMY